MLCFLLFAFCTDSSLSCFDVANSITATNGGHIYMSGYQSVSHFSPPNTTISTTTDFDIICSGTQSCKRRHLRNANNLYCVALQGCGEAQLIENINNVWAMDYLSASESLMKNINNNVYCGNHLACTFSRIINVKHDVFGFGLQTLALATIENVENNVGAVGLQSLFNATIRNVTNTVCKQNTHRHISHRSKVSLQPFFQNAQNKTPTHTKKIARLLVLVNKVANEQK